MAELYDFIPEEQKTAYLAAAQEAFEEAIVVGDAEELARQDAEATQLVTEVIEYTETQDPFVKLEQFVEHPDIDSNLIPHLESYLKQHQQLQAATPEVSPVDRAQTVDEINALLASGDDELIYALTINKEQAPRSLDSRLNIQFQTQNGRWINEEEIDQAIRRWGNNPVAKQLAAEFLAKKIVPPKQ